jgi:alpha-beta hydrolase superfamily lysophospholipase
MATSGMRTFVGSQGHELTARLDAPAEKPLAYALFAHCFTCSKDSKAAAYIAKSLSERGIAVLRFDFTGLGMSGGAFADTTFSSNIGDLLAAAAHMRATLEAPRLLIGHSLGGAAALAAAHDMAEARAVVTLAAPFEAKHVAHLISGGEETIRREGEAAVDIGGRAFRIRREFLDDLERHDPLGTIGSLRKALMIMHSPRDATVSIDNAARIFMAAKHPKSFVSLDDADHLLNRAADAAYAADIIAAWAPRYLAK